MVVLSSIRAGFSARCLPPPAWGRCRVHARLDEAQAGIKIAGKNINNLRYADDTTLVEKVKRN